MIYGYARVSTKEQNLDRQIEQLKEFVNDERNIICDKSSGKNFARKGFNLLVGTSETAPLLRKGDLLIVCSLDRFGRNYTEIKEQWDFITNRLEADIKVLDMPLLDTTQNKNGLDKKFISDLVLQILSYVSEKERTNIRERQRQGIDTARAKGKHLGRPKANYPENWKEVYSDWQNNQITATKAMQKLGLKRTTFYKLVGRYKKALE